jgi:hypothetical protein
MRWPSAWKDPATLDLLKGSPIDCLMADTWSGLDAVRDRARAAGLTVVDGASPAVGAAIVKGVWPGVKVSRAGDSIDAGPTGVPWVNSNGWAVRLSKALRPETAVWVDAPPENVGAASYLIAMADSAAYGGRWMISLDGKLASGLAARQPEALATWKAVSATAAFFATHRKWDEYTPVANVGLVSNFAGDNEFFSHEMLNLLGRAGAHYRVLPKDKVTAESFEGLRATIYMDKDAPSRELRERMLAFAEAGGLLITGASWGTVAGEPAKGEGHPRYAIRVHGRGRIAQASAAADDPFVAANDSVTLMSHRYDLVRFWNGGATGSYFAKSQDGKRAVAHLLFYADRGPDAASVRLAGRFRAVKASSVQAPTIAVEMLPQQDAVEVHLPQVSQYVALELEV